jgi:hypothetical protein
VGPAGTRMLNAPVDPATTGTDCSAPMATMMGREEARCLRRQPPCPE